MNKTEVLAKVKDSICKTLDAFPVELTLKTRFVSDLGADSLDHVNLIMQLEKEFGIVIPDDEAEYIKTLQDALSCVCHHLAEKDSVLRKEVAFDPYIISYVQRNNKSHHKGFVLNKIFSKRRKKRR